jgi:hypothetical protein
LQQVVWQQLFVQHVVVQQLLPQLFSQHGVVHGFWQGTIRQQVTVSW